MAVGDRRGDPNRRVGPSRAGFDYELYNRNDIERILGDKAWCISFKVRQQLCAFVHCRSGMGPSHASSSAPLVAAQDSACRCFGYMVSKKKYVYTIDDDCFV